VRCWGAVVGYAYFIGNGRRGGGTVGATSRSISVESPTRPRYGSTPAAGM
jgi:hypothetical protein